MCSGVRAIMVTALWIKQNINNNIFIAVVVVVVVFFSFLCALHCVHCRFEFVRFAPLLINQNAHNKTISLNDEEEIYTKKR